MFKPWRVGQVAGIDLALHPTMLLLIGFVAYQGGLPAVCLMAAVFGCVLLHELGHALTARRYGIETHGILLSPIGGLARLDRMPRSPGAELAITIAGPAVNVAIWAAAGLVSVVLGGLGLGLGPAPAFLGLLATINLVLAGFNLMPAFPMDGGRVLRALLSRPLGRRKATEIAAFVGQALAIAFPLVMWSLGVFSPLHVVLAGFLYFAAGAELACVRQEDRAVSPSTFGPVRWRPTMDGFDSARRPAPVWIVEVGPGRPFDHRA